MEGVYALGVEVRLLLILRNQAAYKENEYRNNSHSRRPPEGRFYKLFCNK